MPVKKKPIREEYYELEVIKVSTDPEVRYVNKIAARFRDSDFTNLGVKWFEFTVIHYDDDSFEIE